MKRAARSQRAAGSGANEVKAPGNGEAACRFVESIFGKNAIANLAGLVWTTKKTEHAPFSAIDAKLLISNKILRCRLVELFPFQSFDRALSRFQ